MALFIMLTRIDPAAFPERTDYLSLSDEVTRRIQAECPEVTWKANYAILGPYDYLDVFEAPDSQDAARVALIVRSLGRAKTETWNATTWDAFKEQILDSVSMNANGTLAEVEPSGTVTNEVDKANIDSFPASDPPAWTGTAAS
jgi:uncharacterized protein with GYD domain